MEWAIRSEIGLFLEKNTLRESTIAGWEIPGQEGGSSFQNPPYMGDFTANHVWFPEGSHENLGFLKNNKDILGISKHCAPGNIGEHLIPSTGSSSFSGTPKWIEIRWRCEALESKGSSSALLEKLPPGGTPFLDKALTGMGYNCFSLSIFGGGWFKQKKTDVNRITDKPWAPIPHL